MSVVDEFVKMAQAEVDNNSVYVWGGQGQKLSSMTFDKIREMETSDENARRVIQHVADIYLKGIKRAKIFDCSGLITYILMRLGVLSYDTTANGIYKKCRAITKKDLRPGDLVFKVTNEKAVHVAIYKGDDILIEAVGRDEGVKNTKLSSKFNKYGRYSAFDFK